MDTKKKTVNMTEGPIMGHLIKFALPLLAGNLFQQFYNLVDTWTVGNFVSSEAFSAVGTVGVCINVMFAMFMGLANGAGVVISQYYGAKDDESIKKAVHTGVLLTAVLGTLVSIAGYLLVPVFVKIMNTPPEVVADSTQYLRILFALMIAPLFYNMGSGILRALGDSRRPFYFLCVAAFVNIVLDLVFVIKFKMGVAGVAWATNIAQICSAILVMRTLFKSSGPEKVILRDLKFDRPILGAMMKVGLPSALQMSIVSFSNIFVQGYVNSFGAALMGGWTAYSKIDQLVTLPVQSIGLAATTFTGQNIGAGKGDRVRKGIRCSMVLSVATCAVIVGTICALAPQTVKIFISDQAVIDYGVYLLRLITPFHIVWSVQNVLSSGLIGSGRSKIVSFSGVFCFVVLRQIYLFVVTNFISNTIPAVALSYPIGWCINTLIIAIVYFRVDVTKSALKH